LRSIWSLLGSLAARFFFIFLLMPSGLDGHLPPFPRPTAGHQQAGLRFASLAQNFDSAGRGVDPRDALLHADVLIDRGRPFWSCLGRQRTAAPTEQHPRSQQNAYRQHGQTSTLHNCSLRRPQHHHADLFSIWFWIAFQERAHPNLERKRQDSRLGAGRTRSRLESRSRLLTHALIPITNGSAPEQVRVLDAALPPRDRWLEATGLARQ